MSRVTFKDLTLSLEHLRQVQQRLNCWPDCHIIINDRFEFGMGKRESDNELKCYISEDVLEHIVNRNLHWNNIEIGCLIEFDRTGPYLPDVHTMLSYFNLPRPQN